MQYSEFEKQYDRLVQHFGDRGFSKEKKTLLWKQYGFERSELFEKCVNYLILNSRSAPTGQDFEKAREDSQSRYTSSSRACEKCSGSGWSELYIDDRGAPIAERCACVGGPSALASSIERSETNPDPALAQRIRDTFSEESRKYLRVATPIEIAEIQAAQTRIDGVPF